MAEKFLEEFLDEIIIWGEKSACYAFFKSLSAKPEYAWLKEMYDERLKSIESIDKTDPNYQQQLQEQLRNVPSEDFPVVYYTTKKFNLEWSKQLSMNEKENSSLRK